MNLLKLHDPDELVVCLNEECKAVYEWDYSMLQFILVRDTQVPHPNRTALVKEYSRVLGSDDWENQDQVHYCAKCNHMIAISYTTSFEAGQSHLYIPTKE